MADSQIKSRERVAKRGEVFTAKREVNAMLDLVKHETERIDSRFLEPACGDGNFLAEILRRKLEAAKRMSVPDGKKRPVPERFERNSIVALTSIYGVELMMDNTVECRERLYCIWHDEYAKLCKGIKSDDVCNVARIILGKNIVCGNADYNISGTTPEDYPELPSMDYASAITLPQDVFSRMIAQQKLPVLWDECFTSQTADVLKQDQL